MLRATIISMSEQGPLMGRSLTEAPSAKAVAVVSTTRLRGVTASSTALGCPAAVALSIRLSRACVRGPSGRKVRCRMARFKRKLRLMVTCATLLALWAAWSIVVSTTAGERHAVCQRWRSIALAAPGAVGIPHAGVLFAVLTGCWREGRERWLCGAC